MIDLHMINTKQMICGNLAVFQRVLSVMYNHGFRLFKLLTPAKVSQKNDTMKYSVEILEEEKNVTNYRLHPERYLHGH